MLLHLVLSNFLYILVLSDNLVVEDIQKEQCQIVDPEGLNDDIKHRSEPYTHDSEDVNHYIFDPELDPEYFKIPSSGEFDDPENDQNVLNWEQFSEFMLNFYSTDDIPDMEGEEIEILGGKHDGEKVIYKGKKKAQFMADIEKAFKDANNDLKWSNQD